MHKFIATLCSAKFKSAMLILGAFALAGCANYRDIGADNTLRAPTDLAATQSLQTQPGTWPEQQWWLHFGDAQLASLVIEALAHSPSLETAAARVRAVPV
jgi:outer membrane protein TolC